ncbi:MAG: AAA family ATPase [Fusobacterium varium]|uniref:AAA family ATPase n=1 Tax=Fusobacterium varium TaxID=856 RepID=UPI00243061D0|nr:AAA family ATPase [Fusobacterium varium]UYI77424.1 MAG: AAA family ATPase [Fusobacterium varium]
MKINRIHLENYRIHDKLDVEFDSGINLLLGENGKGKSSILEAIGYALFDSELRGGNQKEAIKYGKKSAKIEIEFTGIDGEDYIVTRKIPGSTSIYKKDNPDFQLIGKEDRIRELCGIKGDLKGIYDNVIVAKQNEFISSFKEKDNEREKIFNKVFNTDIYKKIYEGYSRDAVNRYEKDIEIERSSMENIAEIMEDPADIKEKLKFEKGRAKEYNSSLALLNEEKSKVKEFLNSYNTLNLEIEKLTGEINALSESIKNKNEEFTKVANSIKESEISEKIVKENREKYEEYQKYSQEINILKIRKKELEKIKEECLLYEKEINSLEKLNSEIDGEIKVFENKKENNESLLLERKNKLFEIEKEIIDKKGKSVEYKSELSKITPLLIKLEEFEKKLEVGENNIKNFEIKLEEKLEDINKEKEKRKYLMSENLENQLSELEEHEKNKKLLEDEILKKDLLLKENEEAFEMLKTSYCPYLKEQCKNLDGKNIDEYFKDKREKYIKEIEEKKNTVKEINNKLINKNEIMEKIIRLDTLSKEIDEKEVEFIQEKLKLETGKSKIENEKLKLKNFKLENNIESKEKLSEIKITLKTKIDSLDLLKSEEIKGGLEKEIENLNKNINIELKNIEEKKIVIKENIKTLEEKRNFLNENKIFSNELIIINTNIDKLEKKTNSLERSSNLYLENYKKAMEKNELEKNLENIKIIIENNQMKFKEKSTLLELKRKDIESIELEKIQKKDEKITSDIEEIREKLGAVNSEVETLKKKLDEVKKYEDLLKNKRKYLEKLNMKLELTKIFREKIKSMGKEVSKNMLKEIEILATENFRKITGRGEKIVWSNEDKNKYVVFLDGDRGELKFEQLSGGEQVAVAISIRGAMSELFTESKFSIFDEPTNNLDTERRRSLADSIGEILKNLEQSIIVTHDDTFREMAQKVIEL